MFASKFAKSISASMTNRLSRPLKAIQPCAFATRLDLRRGLQTAAKPLQADQDTPDRGQSLKEELRKLGPKTTIENLAYSNSQTSFAHYNAIKTYTVCYMEAQKPIFLAALPELKDTPFTWFLLVHLHMYMILCKMSEFSAASPNKAPLIKSFNHAMFNFLFEDLEYRVQVNRVPEIHYARQIKELRTVFYGLMLSIDEGVILNDAALASALWYNFFGRDCSMASLDMITQHIRKNLKHLDAFDLEKLTTNKFTFLPLTPPPADVLACYTHIEYAD